MPTVPTTPSVVYSVQECYRDNDNYDAYRQVGDVFYAAKADAQAVADEHNEQVHRRARATNVQDVARYHEARLEYEALRSAGFREGEWCGTEPTPYLPNPYSVDEHEVVPASVPAEVVPA